MLTTSPSLIDALRRRPGEADWRRLVQLYTPLLLSWMQARGLQAADAADLVQEVFRVLVRKLPEFEYGPGSSFRGWLRAIVVNIWKDHCRRAARQPALAELEHHPAAEDCLSGVRHRQELVAQALRILQPEFRPETWRIFVEHGVNGRPAAEVAAEQRTTVGAVYAAKCRVLARVREYLCGMLDDEGFA